MKLIQRNVGFFSKQARNALYLKQGEIKNQSIIWGATNFRVACLLSIPCSGDKKRI